MTRLANLLLVSDEPDRLTRFVDTLTRKGFVSVVKKNRTETVEAVAAGQPDLIAVDIASKAFDGFSLAAELRRRSLTVGTPVIAIASKASDGLFDKAEAAGIEDVFVGARPEEELMARLYPLLRLATMNAELERRAALARRFGVVGNGAGNGADEPPYEVLSVGDPGTIQNVAPAGTTISVVKDGFEAEGRLQDARVDALVLSVAKIPDVVDHFELCDRIRHNPRLFTLPIVMLSRSSFLDEPIKAYRHGVSRVFVMPFDAGEVRYALSMLLARQRRRRQVRRALERTKRAETCEALTGAYSKEFFLAHLGTLISSARTWHKHLAVACLDVPQIDAIRANFGAEAGDHLTRQVAQWITAMTRAEDAVTYLADHAFGVAMPDTPLEDAGGVMRRIAGVIGRTEFAVGDVLEPINVEVDVGMADLAMDDTVETLLARSRARLN